jgi:hypothetical protein
MGRTPGRCWGIRNRAFRTLNRKIVSVGQGRVKRLNHETPEAIRSLLYFSGRTFRLVPFVTGRVIE